MGQTALPGRVPPQAVEVERHVIGAMLLDTEAVAKALAVLQPRDFYLQRHQIQFAAIRNLAGKGVTADILTVGEELRRMQLIERAGGEAALMEISAEVASSANITEHCRIVHDKSAIRKLIKAAEDAVTTGYKGTATAYEIHAQLESETARALVGGPGNSARVVPGAEWVKEAEEAYDEPLQQGFSTGLLPLDPFYRLALGQLHVVTGLAGHGKSELLDQIVLNLCRFNGWRAAIFSPENSPRRRHVQKLAEKLVKKPLYGPGRMSFEEFKDAAAKMSKHLVFIDEGPRGSNLMQVLAAFAEVKPEIAVLDPWNRLEHPQVGEGGRETDYIGACLTLMRRFAERQNLALFVVAHPAKMRRDKDGHLQMPGLYDIAGSAHWANRADTAITVWRNFRTAVSEVHVLKMRFKNQGHVGVARFTYDRPSGTFSPALDPKTKTDPAQTQMQLPPGDRNDAPETSDFVAGVEVGKP